jgi:hypothetical protein
MEIRFQALASVGGEIFMLGQFTPTGGAMALAGVLALMAPTVSTAGDGFAPPSNPRLIVPVPILRRHACGADKSVPDRRGVAIMSPVESPDHDCSVVGGKPQCVPYYPDYARPGKHGPRLGVPDNGEGYGCPGAVPGLGAGIPATELPAGIDNASAYGGYSGASQNEAALLHLGGNAAPGAETRPAGTADLIDLLQGRPCAAPN